MRRVSARRRAEMVVYGRERRLFLLLHPLCDACRFIDPSRQRSSCDVHHRRGLTGRNYLDQMTWLAVCRPCHVWIGDHKSKARELGLLA